MNATTHQLKDMTWYDLHLVDFGAALQLSAYDKRWATSLPMDRRGTAAGWELDSIDLGRRFVEVTHANDLVAMTQMCQAVNPYRGSLFINDLVVPYAIQLGHEAIVEYLLREGRCSPRLMCHQYGDTDYLECIFRCNASESMLRTVLEHCPTDATDLEVLLERATAFSVSHPALFEIVQDHISSLLPCELDWY